VIEIALMFENPTPEELERVAKRKAQIDAMREAFDGLPADGFRVLSAGARVMVASNFASRSHAWTARFAEGAFRQAADR